MSFLRPFMMKPEEGEGILALLWLYRPDPSDLNAPFEHIIGKRPGTPLAPARLWTAHSPTVAARLQRRRHALVSVHIMATHLSECIGVHTPFFLEKYACAI